MQASAGLLNQPGMRTSAKLTRGVRLQKRMRIHEDDIAPRGPQPHVVVRPGPGEGAGGGSDDEFAPPDALAVARMRERLTGDAAADPMADL
jgi:hypothetical protein